MTASSAPPDPWRSFRGVMAGTLILEAIVVLLALPVVNVLSEGSSTGAAVFVVAAAVVLLLLAGMQGRPWAIWVNLGAQLVLVAGALLHPGIGFVGVVFGVVWGIIAYLRSEVLRRQRRGELPGQQQAPQ